jgi:hypothetical protein
VGQTPLTLYKVAIGKGISRTGFKVNLKFIGFDVIYEFD